MGKKKKETTDDRKQVLLGLFAQYLREKGRRPRSFARFCQAYELDAEETRTSFPTITSMEKAVWLHWFEETLHVLADSAEYKNYSARERLLSFYYTWMETIQPFSGYIRSAPALPRLFSGMDWFLADMQRAFLKYANELVQLAASNDEIMKRPVITNFYNQALWQQFLFVMNYRLKDTSSGQAKTDEAIERAVNLSFELAGRNQIDSLVDFGKFLLKK